MGSHPTLPRRAQKLICPQCAGNVRSTAKTRNPSRANRRKQHTPLPVTAVTDREYCCDGMITLSVEQLDNHQRNAYGTTKWVADYAGRNPVEGVTACSKTTAASTHDPAARSVSRCPHTRRARCCCHPQPQTNPTNPGNRQPHHDNRATTLEHHTSLTPTRAPP